MSNVEIAIPSGTADRLKLKAAFKEFSDSKVRQRAEGDKQTAIANAMKEQLGVRPEDFRTLANIYHNGNRDTVEAKADNMLAAYDNIVNAKPEHLADQPE